MVMVTLQIRLTKGLLDKIDRLVKEGIYSSRSAAIRDSVRRLVIERNHAFPEMPPMMHPGLRRDPFDFHKVRKP